MMVILLIAFGTLSINISKEGLKTIETSSVPVSNKIVIVDAGHGLPDGGAVSSNGVTESEINLQIAFKLKNLCEQFRNIFSDKKNATEKLKYAVYMTLEYETSLAYNKAPNNDAVYKRLNEKLTQEWEEIKERYDIR